MKTKDIIKLRELYVKSSADFLKRNNDLSVKESWIIFLAQPIGATVLPLKFTNKKEFEKLKDMFYRQYKK